MRLLRREPSHGELSKLREEGELEALQGYIDDPKSSRRLRRRATTYLASTRPGGGKASTGTGSTDPAIVPILAPLLENDPDRAVRRAAAYGLRRTADRGAVQSLLRALTDADKATRIHAIMGLGELQSREAVEPLLEILDDPSSAGSAAKALVDIGDERALDPLRNAATSAKSARTQRTLRQAAAELETRVGHQPLE
jgi:HEAT repeat protein